MHTNWGGIIQVRTKAGVLRFTAVSMTALLDCRSRVFLDNGVSAEIIVPAGIGYWSLYVLLERYPVYDWPRSGGSYQTRRAG